MKITSLMTSFMAISLVLFLTQTASADEVRLKNGDRLTGEIVSLEKESFLFKTSYADEKLSISWQEVACIVSDRPLPAELKGNDFRIGRIGCAESGRIPAEGESLCKACIVPEQQQATKPPTYSGLLNLGGSLASGNTNTRALNVAARFQVRKHRQRFTVDGKYNYGEDNGRVSARNASGSLKYDLFMTEKVYSYAQSLSEQDSFANLNLRNTEGLGLGYQFFDTNQLSLSTEAGISYFYEDVKIGKDTSDAALRWAAGLDWEAIPKSLKLFHHQEGFYSLGVGSLVLHAEQGFRIPLLDNITANFEFDYRFNSSPEAGKKNSDLILVLGISCAYAGG